MFYRQPYFLSFNNLVFRTIPMKNIFIALLSGLSIHISSFTLSAQKLFSISGGANYGILDLENNVDQ
ncbi:hypothetical protein GCM10007940_05250 [Portibacter lacus]|uniref:Uncharacterized protein n=1 Tax=Portibacter lacus TaxID=1099794 RepID=A0AA37SL49_9BACT|nr:hypothetical protein GCM10007940_05250 [Portibacter lacus]